MIMESSPNISIAWCRRLVDNLVRLGIDTFFISPGYRDAPMIAALQYRSDCQLFSCIDERAAGFAALGYGRAKAKPAALLCTSGTAGANYLPAAIEASEDQVPLLVLTCDRPVELVMTKANQAIDHSSFLQGYSKRYISLPAPEDGISPRSLDGTISSAVGLTKLFPFGVVHMNIPLRSPLEPRLVANDRIAELDQRPLSGGFKRPAVLQPDSEDLKVLNEEIGQTDRGLLVLGRLDGKDRDTVRNFTKKLSWPVYGDICSGLKAKGQIPDLEIPASRQFLTDYNPQMIIHLGGRLTSKYLDLFLEGFQGSYKIFSNNSYEYSLKNWHRRMVHSSSISFILLKTLRSFSVGI